MHSHPWLVIPIVPKGNPYCSFYLCIVDPDVLSKVQKPVSFDQGLPEALNMSSQGYNPSEQIGT